jgi:uncharacterized protein (TIGR02001 family)
VQPSFGQQRAARAVALLRDSRAHPSPTRHVRKLLLAALSLRCATPAAADVGASVSLFSEASFRGYSLSEGRPVALLNLSYDHPAGFYAATSATAVFGSGDAVEPLGLQLNGGYVRRVTSDVVLDLGVTHSSYSRYASKGSSSYTEVYAGLSRKVLSARISYAPHYFVHGASAFYGEVDANFSPAAKLNLNAHLGLLVPLDYSEDFEKSRNQHDWRVGVARQFGRVSLHAFLTGGGPDRDYYRGQDHGRTNLVLGLSYPL